MGGVGVVVASIDRLKEHRSMGDDLGNRGPKDRERVNVNEEWELEYWTKRFGCSRDKLKRAVAAVGVMVKDVEPWLKKN